MDLLGLRKRRYWNEIFSNCDFEFARDLLMRTFAGGVVQRELARLLNAYTDNPCRQTAMALIEYDKHEFQRFFLDNKTILEFMMRTKGLDREELSETLHKNVALLRQEPEFEAYCEAFSEDEPMEIQKENKAALMQKGYPEEMISEAFLEYLEDHYCPNVLL